MTDDYDMRSLLMGVILGIRLACVAFGRNYSREVGLL